MSRSYKKSPVIKDPNDKFFKRWANKKVRQLKIDDEPLPKKGKAYKKLFESWIISDYKGIYLKQEAIEEYLEADENSWYKKKFKTLEDYLKYWEKCVKRK